MKMWLCLREMLICLASDREIKMQQWQPGQNKLRRYRHRHRPRRFLWGRLLAVLLGAVLVLFGLVKLIGYGWDWFAARNTSRDFQTV